MQLKRRKSILALRTRAEVAAVQRWVAQFSGPGQYGFGLWMKRSQPVRRVIEREIRRQKLPGFIFNVAMIESGFIHTAQSPQGAVGTWQITAQTARHLGLRITHRYDPRQDPAAATRAACNYLRELHGRFGDWRLALAAYNLGPGALNRRLKRLTPSQRNFCGLLESQALPLETEEYVTKVLAANVVMHSHLAAQKRLQKKSQPHRSTPSVAARLPKR